MTVLSAQLIDPVPIGNGDLLYTAGMHIANVERDGETKPWLVQVDPEFEVSRADRGDGARSTPSTAATGMPRS